MRFHALVFQKMGIFSCWTVPPAADHLPETQHMPNPGHFFEAEGFPEIYCIQETGHFPNKVHFPKFDHFYENKPVWKLFNNR